MQKWEYLFLKAQFNIDKGAYHLYWLNDVEVRDWKRAPSPGEFLDQYGAQGWELVSREGAELIFKRPV